VFEVIHPFHPLYGRTFDLIDVRHLWGEARVYYHDDDAQLCSLPVAWTTEAPPDPFIALAAGRAPFHIDDLVRLVTLIRRLTP
jgi:hypothetical protein